MSQADQASALADAAHDHAWRRGALDVVTNVIEYTCDLCGTTWRGPAPRTSPRR